MYWPKEGSETHGVIQVKLVSEDARATYTVRTFTIRHLKVPSSSSLVPVVVAKEVLSLKQLTSPPVFTTNVFLLTVEEEEIGQRRTSGGPVPLHQLAGPWNTRTPTAHLELRAPVGRRQSGRRRTHHRPLQRWSRPHR